jgi:hypothetical protein
LGRAVTFILEGFLLRSLLLATPLTQTGIPVLGVVENMSGLRQPLSSFKFYAPGGQDITPAVLSAASAAAAAMPGGGGDAGGEVVAETAVFHASGGGATAMAADMGVPFLGAVPLDAALSRAGEEGRSVFEAAGASSAAPALQAVIDKLLAATGGT